ncbi:MAG: Hsp20 family protein [Pirellulales bacterium]
MPDNPKKMLRSLLVSATEECQQAGWHPSADVYRTRRGWLVKFDLAGVRPDEIQVELRGRRLTVRGTRRDWLVGELPEQVRREIEFVTAERIEDAIAAAVPELADRLSPIPVS